MFSVRISGLSCCWSSTHRAILPSCQGITLCSGGSHTHHTASRLDTTPAAHRGVASVCVCGGPISHAHRALQHVRSDCSAMWCSLIPPLSRRGVRHPLVPIGPFPCAWLELASVKSFSWAPLYCVWTTRGERVQGRSLRVNQGDEPRNFSLRCASVAVSSEQQCTQQRESSIGLVYTVQEARG